MDISDFSRGRDSGSTQGISLPTDHVDDDKGSVVSRVALCNQEKPVPDLEDDNDRDNEGSIQQQEQQYHLEDPLQSTSTVESKVASSPLAPVHSEELEWLILKQQQQLLSDDIDTNSDITV